MIKLANHFGRDGACADEDEAFAAFCRALGAKLRRERVRRGMKIPALSELTGLSSSYIERMERGARMPSIRALLRICVLFGLSPGALLDPRECAAPPGKHYGAARAELDALTEGELAVVAELLRAFRELCAKA